jgi:hypothetical protein
MSRDRPTFERLSPPPCDAPFLACEYCSKVGRHRVGGSIEDGTGRTGHGAVVDGGLIGMPYLMRAAKRESDKIGHLASGNDFGPYWNLTKAGEP